MSHKDADETPDEIVIMSPRRVFAQAVYDEETGELKRLTLAPRLAQADALLRADVLRDVVAAVGELYEQAAGAIFATPTPNPTSPAGPPFQRDVEPVTEQSLFAIGQVELYASWLCGARWELAEATGRPVPTPDMFSMLKTHVVTRIVTAMRDAAVREAQALEREFELRVEDDETQRQ